MATGIEIDEVLTPGDALRFLRAVGSHRYVKAASHEIHAFVFAACARTDDIGAACEWASDVLRDGSIDASSRDPALLRRATTKEMLAALEQFWGDAPIAEAAKLRLANLLESIGVRPLPSGPIFEESDEPTIFPALIDIGFELLRLAELDPVRHKGVRDAYDQALVDLGGDAGLGYTSARFLEEDAIPERVPYTQEAPLLGPTELLHAIGEGGAFRAPFVLWCEGEPAYHDYLIRGCLRAAKLA